MFIDFIFLVIVFIILIAGAVFDKQRRAIPKALNITVLVLAGLGAVYQYVRYGCTYLTPSVIALGVWGGLHILNIVLKRRIFGGADLNVYLCVSLCIPVLCNLWTSVWLIPVSWIFMGFWRLSPNTDKDCKERGTPFLYYMLIGFLFMLILNCIFYGFTFL